MRRPGRTRAAMGCEPGHELRLDVIRVTSQSETPGTFRLMYRSRDLIPADERKAALGELFSTARSNNKKLQISGALLLLGDVFVQTLEGDEQAVRALYARIGSDPRHDSVALLEAGDVNQRVFARWSMARVSEDGEPDIALIAHQDGISRAASRGTTPEQEQVLASMREATRAG